MNQSFFVERKPQKKLDEIANEIANKIKVGNRKSGYIKEPLGNLQAYIVRAYLKIKEKKCGELWNGSQKATAEQLSEIYEWYRSTYEDDKPTAKTNRKGLHREVAFDMDEDNYHFDYPYQKNQFDKYIVNSHRPSAVFIMHMAVAFKLSPDELQALLIEYGYLPLHVRNLHHLAIYSVLDNRDSYGKEDNLFRKIKELYFEAIQCVRSEPDVPDSVPGDEVPGSVATGVLKESFIRLGNPDKARFLDFVQTHKQQLHRRHSAILEEHKRLAKVLGELYESRPKGYHWLHSMEWGREGDKTKCYNFECFIEKYCKNIPQKHFKENLIKHIHGDGKTSPAKNHHPTRECMILLWLFAEFYHGHPPISCPVKYLEQNEIRSCVTEAKQDKKKMDTASEDGISFFYKIFDVHQYFFPDEDRSIVENGEDIQNRINTNLQKYGWRPLNEKAQFDKVLMYFLNFKIVRSDSGEISVTYTEGDKTYLVTGIDFYRQEEVPPIMMLLFQVMKQTYTILNSPSATGEKNVVYPLRCDMYEQL